MSYEQDNDNPPPPAACDDPLQVMLQQQVRELDGIFQSIMTRIEVGQMSMNRIHEALRAQAQCQTTVRTLKIWQQQTKEKS